MNPKAANTARAGVPAVPQKDKDAAKQCLILADKFLKDGDFDRARTEVGKAQKLDPTNPYSYAFLDRITHFEEEKKKRDAPTKEAEEARLKAEGEEARKLVEEARQREEAAKQRADEEKRRADAERQRAEEEKRKAQEEERRKAEEKRQKEEEQRQKEEAQKRKAEEERQRAIAAAQKAAMEAKQKAEKQKAAEAAAARMKQEEQKKAADAARTAEQQKIDDEKRKLETFRKIDEARRKREEERRLMEGMLPLRGEIERSKEEKKEPKEHPKEEPKPPPAQPKPDSVVQAARPVIADVLAKRSKTEPPKSEPPRTSTPSITDILAEVSRASQSPPGTPKSDLDDKLDQMRRQIEMLTNALDQERKVREEMSQQKLKGAINQLRTALEKAWVNGVPNEDVLAKLHENAASLGIPEDVEQTLIREVKLDMYSKAVKQVVAKQKLLRNSSRTLEWLRTVYNVTIDEYLEYESKFLMDLVAVQYKGTILFVSSNDDIIGDLGAKLKSLGYAVVNARSPEIALEKIEKINPHYILCDMEFSAGSLSGIKFLHVLRANSKFNYIPFILMCETSEMTHLKSSELRPTEGFIEKPIDMDSLNLIMNEKLIAFREYLSSL